MTDEEAKRAIEKAKANRFKERGTIQGSGDDR